MRLSRYNTLFPVWNDPTRLISSYIQELESRYLLKPKDDGTSTIDINISFSGNSDQISISDSYSNELTTEQEKEVVKLIEMFSKAVDMVFSKGTSGNTETKD